MAAALDSAVAAVAASNSLDPDALRRLRWRHPTLLRRFHSSLTEKQTTANNSKDNGRDNIEDDEDEDKDNVRNAQTMAESGDKKLNAVDGQLKGVEGEGGGGRRKEDEGGGGGGRAGAGGTGEKKAGEEKPERGLALFLELSFRPSYQTGLLD